jgi:hypothetical protein
MQRPISKTTHNAPKILAKSFFKELRENGYDHNAIVAISTELLDLVTQELRQAEGPVKIDGNVVELRKAL